MHTALTAYRDEVISGQFPTDDYSPYKVSHRRLPNAFSSLTTRIQMSKDETDKFNNMLLEDVDTRSESAKTIDKKMRDADEYGIINLY